MEDLIADLELLRKAELLLSDAYLMALCTNLERDWAYAKELRAKCDNWRLKLGVPPREPPSAS